MSPSVTKAWLMVGALAVCASGAAMAQCPYDARYALRWGWGDNFYGCPNSGSADSYRDRRGGHWNAPARSGCPGDRYYGDRCQRSFDGGRAISPIVCPYERTQGEPAFDPRGFAPRQAPFSRQDESGRLVPPPEPRPPAFGDRGEPPAAPPIRVPGLPPEG